METPSRPSDVERDGAPLRSMLVAIGLTVFGLILVPEFMTLPAFLADPALLEAAQTGQYGDTSLGGRTLMMALNFIGMAVAGVIYLLWTDRGLSWIDLRIPTMRDWKYIIGGSVGSIVFLLGMSNLYAVLGVPAAESQIMDIIAGDQTMVLIMIAIVFLFNAPAEEFLFRNIIQKRLYEAFTPMRSVLIASVIFAIVHLPMYMLAGSMVATAASLVIMFGGSVIFGYVYVKADNLLVPTAAHAALNAFQFVILYITMVYGLDEDLAPSFLTDILLVFPL
ncbi:CPBP family intramembrane metalloprotease [Natronolimnobius sp. AArcel1]|uniref:CPBP family intramembrane glutamic endopeptidase n=1 Tax=Natronolimnobius sp. AArcel1 TaxID=1679093 RepID=UPI0013E9D597|nr:CPBP family intramembrane glutamic endopeptidase [Natronolimnobius sp. AArcel1]NGM68800.1 CPBP family intramembrane metalloprotease [Natronolimnobius sp. AArcel1]